MGNGSIRLSEKHGVNPVMGLCRFCGREDGTIAMVGRWDRKDEQGNIVERDAKPPHRAVVSMEPCRTCLGLTKDGVILLSVTNSETNPTPSGEFQFLWPYELTAAFGRLESFPHKEKAIETITKRRIAFISDQMWDMMKLARKKDDKREFVKISKYMPEAPLNSPITPQEAFAVDALFGAEHFKMHSYLWWDGSRLLASLVEARTPWVGAFRNFVHRCQEFKVPLCVPTAVNAMPAILEKWGWTKTEEVEGPNDAHPGEVCEIWYPPKEGSWTGKKEA